MKRTILLVLIGAIAASAATAAEARRIVGTVSEVSRSGLVLETTTGALVVELGARAAAKLAAKIGDNIEIEVPQKLVSRGKPTRPTNRNVVGPK